MLIYTLVTLYIFILVTLLKKLMDIAETCFGYKDISIKIKGWGDKNKCPFILSQPAKNEAKCVQHSCGMHVHIHFAAIACVQGKCAECMQTYF